jgi:hypothetical protein
MKLLTYINDPSSTTSLRLRRVLKKNNGADFKMSGAFSKTIDLTVEKLKLQKDEFENFVLARQKKIDNMEPGVSKNKSQKHLDKIKNRTDNQFKKLILKYRLGKMDGDNEK